jgi:hypothetical protein
VRIKRRLQPRTGAVYEESVRKVRQDKWDNYQCFLRDVVRNPTDDLVRVMAADFIEENGGDLPDFCDEARLALRDALGGADARLTLAHPRDAMLREHYGTDLGTDCLVLSLRFYAPARKMSFYKSRFWRHKADPDRKPPDFVTGLVRGFEGRTWGPEPKPADGGTVLLGWLPAEQCPDLLHALFYPGTKADDGDLLARKLWYVVAEYRLASWTQSVRHRSE